MLGHWATLQIISFSSQTSGAFDVVVALGSGVVVVALGSDVVVVAFGSFVAVVESLPSVDKFGMKLLLVHITKKTKPIFLPSLVLKTLIFLV